MVGDLRNELAAKSIGDPTVLTVTFGLDMQEVDRVKLKELGGGGLLDIGCYAVMFANLVFGREKPERIVASGTLLETGT